MIERLVAFALRKRLVVVLVCIFIALYSAMSG
jgi:Cu/Ag efflux pump CusA